MITKAEYEERRIKLQDEVNKQKLDAFLVSSEESIYYLTGVSYIPFERPFFIIFWSNDNPTFIVPALEKEHMRNSELGDVIDYWEFPSPSGIGWSDKLIKLLNKTAKLGVEPSLRLDIAKILDDFSPKPIPLVETLRLIKSETEIKMLKRASHYADILMSKIISTSYYGASVLESFSQGRGVQAQVLKEGNFEPLTTDIVGATWPAPFSSQPHGIPDISDKMGEGPLVTISSARVNGYAAEVERTYFVKKPSEKNKKIYQDMMDARTIGFEKVKPGVKCSDLDKEIKKYLKDLGHEDYLLHRTGHGLGLGAHEGPWIAEGSKDVLQENMVISIEPGIYIPEIGGFRHSDTVLITKEGNKSLTKYPDDLQSLTITSLKPLKRIKGKMVRSVIGI